MAEAQRDYDKILKKREKKLAKRDKISKRIFELDVLRGLCIILMLVDHTMYDLMMFDTFAVNAHIINNPFMNWLSDTAEKWWFWDVRLHVRNIVFFTFVGVSGISTSLTRSNNVRFIKMTAAAMIISLGSMIFDRVFYFDSQVYFGVLHLLAASLLIYILLSKIDDNKWLYLAVGVALIAMGLVIHIGGMDKNAHLFYDTIPYASKFNYKVVVGLEMIGSDCYGIVPYSGIFLVGAFLGKLLYKDKRSVFPKLRRGWSRTFEFAGRNAIWFYVAHQPIIFIILIVMSFCMGYRFF